MSSLWWVALGITCFLVFVAGLLIGAGLLILWLNEKLERHRWRFRK